MRRTPSARRSRTDAVGVNTIAQQLLRSEAIASSQIEGIDVPGHRALAKAAAAGGASSQAIDLAAKRLELERALLAAEETWLELSVMGEAAN